MKSIKFALLICLAIAFGACSDDDYHTLWSTDPATDPEDMSLPSDFDAWVTKLEPQAEKVLKAAYMTEKYVSTNTTLPGWEGYPVKLYTYHTGKDKEVGAAKVGKVYLLDPDAHQLATWVASTAWKVKRSKDASYTDALFNQVLYQSGGQFPVAGVVYEDMEGDGTYYPYIFKDGVTVYVPAEKHPSNPDEALLDWYLTLTNNDIMSYTGTYARLVGTTREQYTANGGTIDVGTSDSKETRKVAFLDAVRSLYQKAWDSKFNELMIAWAKKNL